MWIRLFSVAGAVCLLPACATLSSGSQQDLLITSEPPAQFQVRSIGRGNVLANGMTPATVRLPRGEGYFKGANYEVAVARQGYKDESVGVYAQQTGSYLAGNLLLGGLLGWLVVDPATGAMWELDTRSVEFVMEPQVPLQPAAWAPPVAAGGFASAMPQAPAPMRAAAVQDGGSPGGVKVYARPTPDSSPVAVNMSPEALQKQSSMSNAQGRWTFVSFQGGQGWIAGE